MTLPSYQYGYAAPGSPWWTQAKYPSLWRGLQGLWAPTLGPTGSTLRDVSGFHNDGTLTNMTPADDWIVGKDGYALDLDGTNDWINLGTATELNFSTVRAAMFWFNADVLANALFTIWDLVLYVDQRALHHTFTGSALVQYWSPDGVQAGATLSTPTLSTGRWYCVVSCYRSGVRELWLDGNIVATVGAGIYTSATTSRLGYGCVPARAVDTPAYFFDGKLSTAALWSVPPSPSSIRKLYDIGPLGMLEIEDEEPLYVAAAAAGVRPQGVFGHPFIGAFGGPV